VHFYRNVFVHVPTTKVKDVAAMLKAIHAQEDRPAAPEKAQAVAAKLKAMKLHTAAKTPRRGHSGDLELYAILSRTLAEAKNEQSDGTGLCEKSEGARVSSATSLTAIRRSCWVTSRLRHIAGGSGALVLGIWSYYSKEKSGTK
jgi:hypothetical protein